MPDVPELPIPDLDRAYQEELNAYLRALGAEVKAQGDLIIAQHDTIALNEAESLARDEVLRSGLDMVEERLIDLEQAQESPTPTLRDPLRWPYPPESFWNMPVSETARLVDLHMPVVRTTTDVMWTWRPEEEVMTLDPDAPLQEIKEHNAGWDRTKTRCASRTGRKLVGNNTVSNVTIPVPSGFTTDPGGLPNGYLGTTPNHSSAHVRWNAAHDDIELLECQPTHICADHVCVSQFINPHGSVIRSPRAASAPRVARTAART